MTEELGRYKILEKLGQGGFATVYRAHDTELDRQVALKELRPSLLADSEGVKRFKREARTIARLNHPRIVTIHDVLEVAERLIIVMHLVDGLSLDKLIAGQGSLPWPQALEILTTVAEALDYAHGQGVLHRDLKPANILLDSQRGALLSDFGLAKLVSEAGSSVTAAGGIVGTPHYIAPEVWEGQGTTAQSDIYALGCILYELLTGEKLFDGDSPPAVMMAHFNPLELPQAWPDDVPAGVADVLMTALAQKPGERYATAGQMARVLTTLANDQLAETSAGEHPYGHGPASRPDSQGSREAKEARVSSPLPPSSSVPRPKLPPFLEPEDGAVEAEAPVFVARERELTQLDEFLTTALAVQGQVVFVTGEAGQGKTSLVKEFAHRAQKTHPDLIVASGNCNAYSGFGDPYLPFRDVMDMLTGAVEARWVAGAITREHARRLWHLLPVTVQALLDAGPDLIDVFVRGTALVGRATSAVPGKTAWLEQLKALTAPKPAGSIELEQSYLFEQYARVLHILAAQRPLLIALDDLQWADAASISLLFHLGRRIGGSRILIMGTYRPDEVALGVDGERHPLDKVLAEFKRTFGDIWVELAQAEEADGQTFVDVLLDTQANRLGAEFRQTLYQQTGGHPLFTVELLRAMQARGDLVQDGDQRWVEGPALDWELLPARVEGVIEERIGRLEAELREILTIASVEGENFTVEVVARVHGLSQRQLLRQLSQALQQRHRLVREREEIKTGQRLLSRYQFAHILFQRYLYDSMSAGERRLLHSEIARALATVYEEHTEEIAAQLVHHFLQAGERVKAIEYARQAARRAKTIYAYDEAGQHLQTALDLLETGEQVETQLALLEDLADVHGLLRQDAQAISLYQAALEQWPSLTDADSTIAVRLHRKILQKAWAMDFYKQFEATAEIRAASRGYLESSLILTEAELPQLERVRVLTALAKIGHGTLSDLDTAERYAQAAVNLAEQLDAPKELSDALEALAIVHFEYGRLPAYLAVSRRRLTLSRDPRFGDVRKQIDILSDLSSAMISDGEYAQAIAYLIEAESLAAQHPALVPPLWTLGHQALCWLRLDRWDELFQVDKKRQDLEQRYAPEQFGGGYCMERAVAAAGLALQGDFDQARVLREQAYDFMVQGDGSTENWGRTQFY